MPRPTHKTRSAAPASPGGSGKIGLHRVLMIAVGFVIAAILGVWLIRTHVGAGRPIVDVAELDRQQEIRRNSIEAVTRAERLMRDGNFEEARRIVERVTETDPKFYPGHLVLGFIHMRSGKLALAEQATRKAYELEPNDHAVGFQMGQTELLQGKGGAAIEALVRAVRLRKQTDSPPEMKYHLTLADAFLREGQPDLAADQIRTALEINRSETLAATAMLSPQVQVAVARLLLDRREVADATRLFEQAAEQVPDQAEIQYQAARAHYVQGKFEAAAPFIERAISLDPSNPMYVQLRRQISTRQFGVPETAPGVDIDALLRKNGEAGEPDQALPDLFKR